MRCCIHPGNTESLWKAVKVARDVNTNELPQEMFVGGLLTKKKYPVNDLLVHFVSIISKVSKTGSNHGLKMGHSAIGHWTLTVQLLDLSTRIWNY